MGNLLWPVDAGMARPERHHIHQYQLVNLGHFPQGVDPAKTLHSWWKRCSGKGIFAGMMQGEDGRP
jgi:hypothetical protein